ncbi:PREDICTED: uncharacterized protein LOC104789947 [Camelina sativa]|uniref:Uncharacterized protein LOC104789947 n=1 Tax=Camelina sativa TaxID=90675 RepID=A0ABM0ZCR2_CAMSA|nr:PREDICTED: uncharacterized protein LOC104789947 [Camelina sativa]
MVLLGLQFLNWYVHGGIIDKKKKRHLKLIVQATERDDSSSSSSSSSSQRFQIDRDKAREALKQLDQQIESQADEKPRIIIKTSPDVVTTNDPIIFEEPPEMSGSFLTTSAFVLLALTLFYNILFITVIKPSMDGPESVPEANIVAMSDSDIVKFPLSSLSANTFKQ